MLKFKVMKVTLETMRESEFEFEADGEVEEKHLRPYKVFLHAVRADHLAWRIVSLQKNLVAQKRIEVGDDYLVVEFPRIPEVFHPENGLSRIKFHLSDQEILEFWRYLRNWSNRHRDSCEV